MLASTSAKGRLRYTDPLPFSSIVRMTKNSASCSTPLCLPPSAAGSCRAALWEGDANPARLNMPLELGIAMAHRYLSRRAADRHDWLILVPLGHRYQAFISDISGFDPVTYDGSVPGIVTTVMAWLATRSDTSGHLIRARCFPCSPNSMRRFER